MSHVSGVVPCLKGCPKGVPRVVPRGGLIYEKKINRKIEKEGLQGRIIVTVHRTVVSGRV